MASSATGGSSSKETPTNPRGIPYAPFVDKVEDYVTTRAEVEGTLKSFQEMIAKYQFMQTSTRSRLAGLEAKIPDIQKTLDVTRFLSSQRQQQKDDSASPSSPLETTFELNDTLYARALVQPGATEEVYLWLGANVMLAYPLPEAIALLEEKLGKAKMSAHACEEDLEFLREQVTTLEVATARVYNWDVAQRRKERAEAEAEGGRK